MVIGKDTRAAYFLSWGEGDAPSAADSMKKKIAQQMRLWASLGVRTKLFVAARRECRASWEALVGAENLHVEVSSSRLGRLRAFERVRSAIRAFAPEFVYLRQEPWLPSLELLVRELPTFMELNGDDVAEARSGPKYYYLYKRLTHSLLNRNVAGFVSVAHELVALPSVAGSGKPSLVIANGIDLSAFPTLPVPSGSDLRFAFMGARHGAAWHGISKIVDLAHRKPEWRFEVIGMTREDLGGSVPRNVETHGILTREQYEPILATCDIAFGTLSAYAKDCFEASPLKVRESLAFGLPVVTGVRDTDFDEKVPFILELPNTERNVADNVERIASFAAGWKGRRVPRQAIQHLDAAAKERRRVDFIRDVSSRLAGRRAS